MHSTLVRLQNVFGFFTTVAFTVASVIALSSFISPQNPSASISLQNVQLVMGRPHYYSPKREEYAHIKFDLNADLSSLFNWNTKQVFVYLKAVYPSTRASEPPSEAIIWDAILASKSAPWHTGYFVHPDKKSKLSKQSAKKRAASKSKTTSPYPIGELHLENNKPKYKITDITGKLGNRTDVTLELGWNVQPWVGALTWTNWNTVGAWRGLEGGRSKAFTFPEVGAKAAKPKDLETEKGAEGYRLVVGEEVPLKKAVV
ncbi:unnamed protein product [Alternaria alternata]